MKTQNTYRHLLIGATFLITAQGFGQVTVPSNSGLLTDFVGWDATMLNDPLNIKHEANQPIDFYTTNRFRMRINPRLTWGPLNNFNNIPADGFALITPDFSFLNVRKSPYSRLHLAEGVEANTSPWGYRLWQRNGITFTGNDDHGYIGHKYGEPDVTDMVIQWSDNPGFSRADRMRFIFTSEFLAGTPTGMNSLEGLEGMYWM